MTMIRRNLAAATVAGLALAAISGEVAAQTKSRVTIGVTENISYHNPYADSVSQMYAIWCSTYGCLGYFDFAKGDYVGLLADRWEVKDPNTWIFHLRRDVKRHDGGPFRAEDVVHSIDRANNDPQTSQKQNVAPITKAEVIDDHTVRITTKEPTAPLLEYIFDRLMITSKELFDKHGQREVDRRHPLGFGPYKVRSIQIGESMVIEKNTAWPGILKENPDEVIFRVLREPEARVTALLNNEIQIAQYIPPHLVQRVENARNVRAEPTSSVEIMFIAMSPKHKPWDNMKLRQAVAYAIDRETIIKTILQGRAEVLHGPIGPGQYGYDPNLQPRYSFDPAKARRLVVEAGFPNGVDVEFFTPVARYINDKQISEAVVAMLGQVGIRARLMTPEWATLWADVRKGNTPFYYLGRGSVVDPTVAIAQYFETGGSPRIGYSNPKVDELLRKERQTFDPVERKKTLNQVFSIITEEAPAHFMWRHQQVDGVSNTIDYQPTPSGRILSTTIRMRNPG
ncbi:MAG: peptide ABC transporter substrate-binding protein [Alphaproteobacteria bacterium]|nr:peptide ABC transporter substrate-binding protein [Alphaproteobacteria bacterium]